MTTLPHSTSPRAKGRIGSFLYGATVPLQAARTILRHPVLILWSLLPVSITVFLYIYVIAKLQDDIGSWALGRLPESISPDSWIATGLSILVKILLLVVSAVTFSIVASIVASPFNDFLAESSEKYTDPQLPPPLQGGWGLRVNLIFIDLGKTIAAGVATVFALLVSWIPIINLIGFMLAALLVCFQFISYPQTRRAIGLGGGVAFLWRYFFACAGFGAAISFLFAIPFLSSLCLPLAVVGGTILVARAPGDSRLGRLR